MRFLEHHVAVESNSISLQKEALFIKAHLVHASLRAVLDDHSETLATLVQAIDATPHQKHGVWKFEWLPGYYVKYNVDRLFMRERLAHCIESYNLNLLHTPKKYLYHIKGRPAELSNLNYVVIIKEVTADPLGDSYPMGLEQIQQFIVLIEKTGHCSTFAHNYLRLGDGRISFIDTDGTFNTQNPIRGIIDLLNRDLEFYYTPEALSCIIDRIARHLVQLSGQELQRAEKRITMMVSEQKPHISLEIYRMLKERIAYHKEQQKNRIHKKSDNRIMVKVTA